MDSPSSTAEVHSLLLSRAGILSDDWCNSKVLVRPLFRVDEVDLHSQIVFSCSHHFNITLHNSPFAIRIPGSLTIQFTSRLFPPSKASVLIPLTLQPLDQTSFFNTCRWFLLNVTELRKHAFSCFYSLIQRELTLATNAQIILGMDHGWSEWYCFVWIDVC